MLGQKSNKKIRQITAVMTLVQCYDNNHMVENGYVL